MVAEVMTKEDRRPKDLLTRNVEGVNKIRNQRREELLRMGKLMERIRDSRVYTERYGTFEEFCYGELGLTSTRVNQIIRASVLATHLIEATGSSPRSERQLRDLYNEANHLDWKGTVQAWRIAMQLGGEYPKAQHLKRGIEEARKIMIAERRPIPERRPTTGIGRTDALEARRAYERGEVAKRDKDIFRPEDTRKLRETLDTLRKTSEDWGDLPEEPIDPPRTLAEKAEAARKVIASGKTPYRGPSSRSTHKVKVEPPTPLLDRVAEYHGFDDLEAMLKDFVERT